MVPRTEFRFISFDEFCRLGQVNKLAYIEEAIAHLRGPENVGRSLFTDMPGAKRHSLFTDEPGAIPGIRKTH